MLQYIDIHTHKKSRADQGIIQVSNIMISKDYMLPQLVTTGIHPWYIDMDLSTQLETLKNYSSRDNVIAIGECGLDKVSGAEWNKQKEAFISQIKMANKTRKPLIIHCVRAFQECLQLLKEQDVTVPVIFHGFAKKKELAEQIIANGYYISLGSAILKGQHLDLIKEVPISNIFFETDDKSIKIVDIYMYFCRVRKIELNVLKEQIEVNFKTIFKYAI